MKLSGIACLAITMAIAAQSLAQGQRLGDLPTPAQEFLRKNPAALSFVGFLANGNEVIFSSADGLLRHVDLANKRLVRTFNASARRDQDIYNWAARSPIEHYTNRFIPFKVAVSPNGKFYSFTDARNVAWVCDATTGAYLFNTQTAPTNGTPWWSGNGMFYSVPLVFRVPGEDLEHGFSLVEFDPETKSIAVLRSLGVSQPGQHETPRGRWMNGTWWYNVPGGSISTSNNRMKAPYFAAFFSESNPAADSFIPLPILVRNSTDVAVHPQTGKILVHDRDAKKVWLTQVGQEVPTSVGEYSVTVPPGYDGSLGEIKWVGPRHFAIITTSAKRVAGRLVRDVTGWSLRSVDLPMVELETTVPRWASPSMTFSPDGTWVIDSMYFRKRDTGKGWLVESNFAVHPDEATIKITDLE